MEQPVVVVGGGHAGVEAAAAAARRGADVLLLCLDAGRVGAMSCNPAIGGIGKGHLVREVDALDGVMGIAADRAAIHYRMLNRSKGRAVQGPRVQADRAYYKRAVREILQSYPGITVVQGEVARLRMQGEHVGGVVLADGRDLPAASVVLATGTFLGGRLYRGEERWSGGRVGEGAAVPLAAQLREFADVRRLKTGTPPRLDGRTIDWSRLARQQSDRELWTMSPLGPRRLPQLSCGVTRTNDRAHDIIRRHAAQSPLLSGELTAGGPRYCPSIEDKITRFGDRDGHQIFLEPEGLATATIYPNGISTSLPVAAQAEFVRAIEGLERAEIVVPGYAVEYDHLDPRWLTHGLGSKRIVNLFCAGQINGTTGYEEAAAQGLVAGANAAAAARGLEEYQPARDTSYLGVLVDDLVLGGVTEPYRMLTARAEHRLRLRADNATTRLSAEGRRAGLLSPERQAFAERHADELHRARTGDASVSPAAMAEVEEDVLYAPYLARQEAELRQRRAASRTAIPRTFDYTRVPGLSLEMRERLARVQPATMAEAERIPGVSPAALTAVLLHVAR